MTTQALDRNSNPTISFNIPSNLVVQGAIMGASGAAAGALFTLIDPLGGAIFGVSSFLSNRLIHWTIEKVGCCPANPVFKTAQLVLSLIVGIGAGILITTAAGFPMTFAAGVGLTIALIGTAIATILALGGCWCSSAITTGLLVGDNNYQVRV